MRHPTGATRRHRHRAGQCGARLSAAVLDHGVITGNLCVVRSTHSHREIYDAVDELQQISVAGDDSGLYGFGPAMTAWGDPVLRMDVDRWTPGLDDIWHRIGAPDLQLVAWMRTAD